MSEHEHHGHGVGDSGALTWVNGIKTLFAPYVQCMLQATNGSIDLGQYSTAAGTGVADNIQAIQQQIDSGAMPRGASYQAIWKNANGKTKFDQWYGAGYPQQ